MKKFFALVFVLLVGIAPAHAACKTDDPFPYTAPYDIAECPVAIQSWLDRVNACAHFAGEDPYDAERKKYIDDIMAENRCNDIGCDFETLFREYEGDIAYTGVLTGYAELVYESTDNLPKCVPEQ